MSEQELEGAAQSDDFDAGFTGAPTETPGQSDTEITEKPEQQVEQQPKFRQITEEEYGKLSASAAAIEEMRATLGKQVDTAFGKIGGLERVLKQYQEQTPSGAAVEITEEDLAEIRDEFPELVGPQLKALQRVASKMRGTGGFDESRVQPMLDQAGISLVVKAKAEIAEETLDETHPDWKQIVGIPEAPGQQPSTEYRKWLATQPKEYQERVNNSYSPVVLGRSLDKFNEHLVSLKKNSDRRDRFDQAVTPRGEGGHEPPADDNDAFISGFSGG